MSTYLRGILAIVAVTLAVPGVADDAYFDVPIRNLKITDGTLPASFERPNWQIRARTGAMRPRAVLEGEGEVYIGLRGGRFRPWMTSPQLVDQGSVCVCAPEGRDVAGWLFVPNSDWNGMRALKFTIPAVQATPQARTAFCNAKRAHYGYLLRRQAAGAAWFRHQERRATALLQRETPGRRPSQPRTTPTIRRSTGELARTYALFTGGRAMSENLQLDRVLPPAQADEQTVKISSIQGISVKEIDWTKLVEGLQPELDPLAARIPADQHVLFFPSFDAAVRMADEAAGQGTPILRLAEPRSENAMTQRRYERQMCISLDAAARLLGPQLVRSMALTGSDPYYRTGTDVAVLLETDKAELLKGLLLAQVNLAIGRDKEVDPVQGKVDNLVYHGARSPDRRISCYVAKIDGAVVVTNSLHQLGRLASVHKGESKSIVSLPEYKFFRNRYKLGDPEETALVFLSDATIRRWCGPRWRIGTSRRTRDMAVIAEMQAAQLDKLVRGRVKPGPLHTDLPIAEGANLTLGPKGVASSVHGTLAFMTPIAEVPIQRVTKGEAEAYQRWRDGYQRNWTVAFDPIAVRLSLQKDKLAADLSVIPLIVRTRYRQFISLSEGVKITPDAGDQHGAPAHLILAVNKDSQTFQQASNFAKMMMKGFTLGWLGDCVEVYADADPFWQDLANVPENEREQFFMREAKRLPVAVRAEVTSGFKLAAFLTGLRTYIEQTAPGMTVWETLQYKNEPYVRVSASEKAKSRNQEFDELAIHYAASGDSLVVTLSETVLKRALDRQIARRNAKAKENKAKENKTDGKPSRPKQVAPAETIRPWLGTNLCLQVDRSILGIATAFSAEMYQSAMQSRAWGNLPIINEWRRLYPDEDPVKLHERIWHIRLVCPGGGEYVWNEKWRTMESTVYGHPGQPRKGPIAPPVLEGFASGNFGLSFEDQGLRARVSLQRQKPSQSDRR